ncbi:PolC-type DNA polymerase III [Metamycoplasma neophronis]|nr:PolC-type DNA polymerase III [Metamycoplasma neophronis]
MRFRDESFVKLCKEINFSITEEFSDAIVEEVVFDNKTGVWSLKVSFDKHININQYKEFRKALDKRFPKCIFYLVIRNVLRDKNTIIDYLTYITETKHKSLNALKGYINVNSIKLTEDEIWFVLPIKAVYDQFVAKAEVIKKALKAIGYGFYRVNFKLEEADVIKNSTMNFIDNMVEEMSKLKKMSEIEEKNESKKPMGKQFFRRESQKPIEMDIESATQTYEEIMITTKGEIFKIDSMKLKTGKTLYTVAISDYKEAIYVKKFLAENEEIPNLKIGETIIVTGKLTNDTFSKTKAIMASGKEWYTVTEGLTKIKKDYDEVKRIELAARTNMSAQDGISTPLEYCNALKSYGVNAIAITDLDDVQAFPELFKCAKSNPTIKPIYGITMSSLDSSNNFFYGFKDFDLKEQEYIVFDLETTGLSPRFDEIIEFGGIIMKAGGIIEKIQFFIKPNHPLSAFTVNLTHITDEMVAKGLSQEEGIRKIHSLLSNRVCVAHNANFDVNFCKQKFKELGLDCSQIYGIDTLAISHFLNPYERKHTLGAMSKRLGVTYDTAVAHRADYDAEVLSRDWVKMIEKLKRDYSITTSRELNDVKSFAMLARKFTYESRVLVKNQIGLKKLFKLVTRILTDQYNEGPQLYFNEIGNDPDLLFGSGTHGSYLWEQVFNGTDENIEKAIKMYDYIELPPISSFQYLINDDRITEANLKFAYKDLIDKATKLNKLCVAVSDCRYVFDYQRLIYEVYINAPSLGGGFHWLKGKSIHPNLIYLTTDEMLKEFNFLNDGMLVRDIVVNNTHKIADQIEGNIEVIKNKLYFPEFDNSPEKLRAVVYKNLSDRYGENPDQYILDRIEKELNPIIKYGYSVTYWISHKLVQKSNQDGYLVGSRGSVGSSLVANLADISEVNPLPPHYLCTKCKHFEWNKDPQYLSGWDLPDKKCDKCGILMEKDGHNIPFETFLGFEANKVPDIDLNFSGVYQPTIHNYVKELFGESHTLRAGTISTVAEKTAFGFCKKYEEEQRTGYQPWTRSFLEFLAIKTSGVKRTTGQHPGGIIIIPKEYDVEDFTPINFPANDDESNWKTSHFDYHAIHDNVLKLDLLGHDDPTVVKMLEDLTNTKVKRDVPRFDPEVLKLFYTTESLNISPKDISGETTGAYGLPEFGTNFVRKMLKEAQPRSFNDLILLSGLSHGTDVWSGNAEKLVKEGKKINECVCCRDDIMGYLIDKGIDKLKSFEIMEKVRKGKGLSSDQEKLLLDNNVPEWYIESLKKIKYMFPKAHATAYVIMAWRIAWYKLYYPLEFYASYYTNRPDAIDIATMSKGIETVRSKLAELRRRSAGSGEKLSTKENALIPMLEITEELYARGYKIKNVDLNKSLAEEWIVDRNNKALIPPFVVVDGLGATVADSIIEAREENHFNSIEDLKRRSSVNSKIITSLTDLGVLEGLDETDQETLF